VIGASKDTLNKPHLRNSKDSLKFWGVDYVPLKLAQENLAMNLILVFKIIPKY